MVDVDASVLSAARRYAAEYGDLPDDAALARIVRDAGRVLGGADRAMKMKNTTCGSNIAQRRALLYIQDHFMSFRLACLHLHL